MRNFNEKEERKKKENIRFKLKRVELIFMSAQYRSLYLMEKENEIKAKYNDRRVDERRKFSLRCCARTLKDLDGMYRYRMIKRDIGL